MNDASVTLRSLCCNAPPSGTSRMHVTSNGYHVGFCSACHAHSAFTPPGEGRLRPVALPPLREPQETRERQLDAIERRVLGFDLFKTALGLIALAIALMALFYVSWALGERERRQRGAQGAGEVGVGGICGLVHTRVM